MVSKPSARHEPTHFTHPAKKRTETPDSPSAGRSSKAGERGEVLKPLRVREHRIVATQKKNKRKRGRPPKSSIQDTPLDRIIVEAAKQVCCDSGIHALTVELILQEAGISRPTFYKFFKNKEMVLELVSKEANQKLVEAMRKAVLEKDRADSKSRSVVDAIIDTYLEWGMQQGVIVSKLYQAMTDETSIVTHHRKKTVDELIDIFQEANIKAGAPKQDPLLLNGLINMVEYLGTPLFSNNHSKKAFMRVRNIMRMVLEKVIFNDEHVPYYI